MAIGVSRLIMSPLISRFCRIIHLRGREAWGTSIADVILFRGWNNRGCCRRQRKVGCALSISLAAEGRYDWILPRRPPHRSRHRRIRLQRVHRARVARGRPGKPAPVIEWKFNKSWKAFRIGLGIFVRMIWCSLFFTPMHDASRFGTWLTSEILEVSPTLMHHALVWKRDSSYVIRKS